MTVFAIDKLLARMARRRIPEVVLLLLAESDLKSDESL